MNFARHQDQAERTARRLLWLFALATLSVVLAVNVAATLLWQLLTGDAPLPYGFHATNTGVVAGLILGGAWLETVRLRDDGARIARRLGAVPVDTDADPLQRRLQNLLEELSIVARIGVPRAFVLHDEPSINALTVGMDRNQSVVVVTRGALARLTRDELQGVLAHELSHVVNGDARLNTRLVGLNHGLELVAMLGRSMLARVGDALRTGGPAVLLAVPLLAAGTLLAVLGAIGELAARAIRAGVGRQREFFADAQAIEFTRHRDGLGGALRKVAGLARAVRSRGADRRARSEAALAHPYAGAVSHLLLVGPDGLRAAFATHPPLGERLQRLYGRPMAPIEPLAADELDEAQRREPDLPLLAFAPEQALGPDGEASAGAILDTPSIRLVEATREPAAAAALVIALIAEPTDTAPDWGEGWSVAASRWPGLRDAVAAMPIDALRSLRWPLMELAVARLRPLSRPARESLLATARARVAGDGRVTLREWVYFGLLRLRLAPPAGGVRPPVLGDPIDARSVRVLFALVAHAAQLGEARAERAANAAIRALELAPIGGSAGELTLVALERAMERAGRLPPLARPLLVRQLVALLPHDADADVRDFLRLLCVAIDCPPPQFAPRSRAAMAHQAAGQPSRSHAAA